MRHPQRKTHWLVLAGLLAVTLACSTPTPTPSGDRAPEPVARPTVPRPMFERVSDEKIAGHFTTYPFGDSFIPCGDERQPSTGTGYAFTIDVNRVSTNVFAHFFSELPGHQVAPAPAYESTWSRYPIFYIAGRARVTRPDPPTPGRAAGYGANGLYEGLVEMTQVLVYEPAELNRCE